MALYGGDQDRSNILRFLRNFELNLEIDAIDNASRKNIVGVSRWSWFGLASDAIDADLGRLHKESH
jgi:hypothetical protein